MAYSPTSFDSNDKTLDCIPKSPTFLRIYFENSTAVVKKNQISLREALTAKLKKMKLDIDDCVAYSKEKNEIIEWDIEASQILENDLVIKLREDAKHNFVKRTKFFSNRICDICKGVCNQSFIIYSCKKCDNSLCQNDECKRKIEKTVCLQIKKNKNLLKSSPTSIFIKPKMNSNLISGALKRKWPKLLENSNSEQILPITEITFSPRARSFSDPDNSSIFGSENRKTINIKTQDKEVETRKGKKPNRWSSLLSWEIPPKRIQINKQFKIGTGSFGVVHKGTDFFHGAVAVKFLSVNKPTNEQIKAFKNEVAILKSTRHDNVLLFIGCFLSHQLAIVTEWCPGSSLYRHLHVDEVTWEMDQLIDIAKQTSTGMEYLHAKDIIHRDLKSNNIFLVPKEHVNNYKTNIDHNMIKQANNFDKTKLFNNSQFKNNLKWTVKIGDFGLATVKSAWIDETQKKGQPTGSILWMAPEVIRQKVNDPYTQKSDVYSFAVVLYELATGSLPFQNKEQNMILFLVGSGRLKLDTNDCRIDTPKELKDLITVCSDYDRDKRFDFIEITKMLSNIEINKTIYKILTRTQSAPNIFITEDFYSPLSHSDYYSDDLIISDQEDEEFFTNMLDEPESPYL